MEEKLYYQDPYLRSAEAGIVAVEENNVYFDRTVFYPEAGGQPGDRGVFEGRRIVDTKKTGKGIAHVFDDASGLYVGMHGTMTLDLDHRHAFMEKHSAQHLISSLFFGMFGLVWSQAAADSLTVILSLYVYKHFRPSAGIAAYNAARI